MSKILAQHGRYFLNGLSVAVWWLRTSSRMNFLEQYVTVNPRALYSCLKHYSHVLLLQYGPFILSQKIRKNINFKSITENITLETLYECDRIIAGIDGGNASVNYMILQISFCLDSPFYITTDPLSSLHLFMFVILIYINVKMMNRLLAWAFFLCRFFCI